MIDKINQVSTIEQVRDLLNTEFTFDYYMIMFFRYLIVDYIEKNGSPEIITFDHDLADTHYTPEEFWSDYDKSKEWQEKQVYKEKTGYECAKWLIDYCIENSLECPMYVCHSMNPVGRDNILGVLDNFRKYQNGIR